MPQPVAPVSAFSPIYPNCPTTCPQHVLLSPLSFVSVPTCLSLSLSGQPAPPGAQGAVGPGPSLLGAAGCSPRCGVVLGGGGHLQVWAEWPLFASTLHNAAVVQSLVALGGWSGAPKHPRAPLGTTWVGMVLREGVQLWWQAEKCGGTQGCGG